MTVVRRLKREDAGLFRHIRLFGLSESPSSFGASLAQEETVPLEVFEQRIDSGPDKWVVGAFTDRDLVGVIGFSHETGDKSRHKGFIWGMYVLPEFRCRGIGRALFQDALARIDALTDLRSVRLAVVTSNTVALRLYERFGFVRFGEETDALCVDGIFHSEYHMVRSIRLNSPPPR